MTEADDALLKGVGLAGCTLALELFAYLRDTQGWTKQLENDLLDNVLNGLENILPADHPAVQQARRIIEHH
jgi:hypothetical protein